MAYADGIRDADTVTLDTIADLIEGVCSATGNLVWTAYDPTWGVTGGSWSTNPAATDSCHYTVIGDLTIVRIYGTGTSSAGDVTSITVTLPSTPSQGVYGCVEAIDNGAGRPGYCYNSTNTLTIKCYQPATGSATWTGGATTGVGGFIVYYN